MLLSFAVHRSKGRVVAERYSHTFRRVLIDSGAFSVLSSGVAVDPIEYRDWAAKWIGTADAIAGLDDISGDWRQSLSNYEVAGGFPTMHDTDPAELLDDLVVMARERGGWLGVGLKPPRHGKERWLRDTLARVPDGIHVHGWALAGLYSHLRRIDSSDSTAWLRVAMRLAQQPELRALTYGECIDIAVKTIARQGRRIDVGDAQMKLLNSEENK